MKKTFRFFMAAFVGFLLAVACRIYQSRVRVRVPSPESIENPEVASAFNRIASWPQMRLLRWYVARRILRLEQTGQAVDLGCGPGHLIFNLAEKAPELYLSGIDLSEELLSQANRRVGESGYGERVSFKKGSAQEIPFPDGSLDLVMSSLSLHHWSEPQKVLDEVARVLKAGGAFLIFDLRRDMAPPFYLLLWFVTRFVVPKVLRGVNEPMGSRNAAYSPAEVSQLAAKSNLSGWRILSGPLWLILEGRKLSAK